MVTRIDKYLGGLGIDATGKLEVTDNASVVVGNGSTTGNVYAGTINSGGVELRANDYATLLSARSNDGATLNLAYSNDGSTLSTARANDFNTYSVVLGGLTGANTAILNLQTGLTGVNTDLSGNVAIFAGAFNGSNTNIINLIVGLAGSNTDIVNLTSGLIGSNTSILNLQSGISGTNTNLSGNVAIFTGAFTGSNARLSGAESNVIALQGGISGANTVDVNQTTGMSGTNTNLAGNVAIFNGAFTGSNTRLAGAESNVIALQGGLAGANTNISAITSSPVTFQSSVTILGNLTLSGNTTIVTSNTISFGDTLLSLGANNTVSDNLDIGLYGHYWNGTANSHSGIFRSAVSKDWMLFANYIIDLEGNSTVTISNSSFQLGTLRLANANAGFNVSAANAILGTSVYSGTVELRANDYATYLMAKGGIDAANTINTNQTTGLTGANTNITNLTSGLTGANTNITALTGGLAGANTAIALRALAASPTFTGNATFDTNTLFVDSINDRVGLLTTLPGFTLDVRGTANTGALTSTTVSSGGVELRANDYATYLMVLGGLTGANTNITALTGGLVGANTAIALRANIASPTFTGTVTTPNLTLSAAGGIEGGQLDFANAVTNTTITTGIAIDIYGDQIRFFEKGANTRGAYINLAAATPGVGSNLLAGSGGGGSETANVIALQGGLAGANTAIALRALAASPTFTGNATFDTTTLFVDSINDRVGLITTLPGFTLDVRGTANTGALTSTTVSSGGVELRANDYATILAAYSNDGSTLTTARSNDYSTYLVAAGGISGANTNITNLTSGLTGANTNITALTGGLAGANTAIALRALAASPTFTGNATFDTNTLFVDSLNDRVGIGTSSPTAPLTVVSSNTLTAGSPSIILQGESNTERMHIRSSGAGGATSVFLVGSSRGTTASPTVIQSGDALGYYQFGGYNGTSWTRGAWVSGFAEGTWNVSAQGSSLAFSTTPSGSTTMTEAMRIDSNARILIGSTATVTGSAGSKVQIFAVGNNAGIDFCRTDVPTAAVSLVGIGAYAYDGNVNVAGSTINFRAAENWTSTNHGTDIQFRTIPIGSGAALTESMRITANGSVGIGTSSPGKKLDVYNSGTTTTDFVVRNDTVQLSSFVDSGAGYLGTATSHPLLFLTTNTERMRIDTSGRALIGLTASKTYGSTLQVQGGIQNLGATSASISDVIAYDYNAVDATPTYAGAVLRKYGSTASGNLYVATTIAAAGWAEIAGINTSGVAYGTNGAAPVVFGTGGVERMRIDSNGNMGIGTSSPTSFGGTNLNIKAPSSSTYGSILIESGTYVWEALVNQTSGVMSMGARSNHPLTFAVNDTERMRIDTSGNVGIGTASAAYKLDVRGSANVGALTATSINIIPSGSIIMYGANTAPSGWLVCDGTAVSRSTYAGLFAVVSNVFGIGDNTTTFNLPDFRGRSPYGVDASQSIIIGASSVNKVNVNFQTTTATGTSGSTADTNTVTTSTTNSTTDKDVTNAITVVTGVTPIAHTHTIPALTVSHPAEVVQFIIKT